MSLRSMLDSVEPHFHKGGKYEKFYALYELRTPFFTPQATSPRLVPMYVMVSILNG